MKSGFNPVKCLKVVLIIAAGVGVYMTERALRTSKSFESRSQARRSLTNEQLVDMLEKQPPAKTLSAPLAEKLQQQVQPTQTLPNYIVEVKPKAILWKQKKSERREFEKRFSKTNVTRWQYPDFVRVPLSSLGVVFYNGQRFYRQGVSNPPEYQKNSTDLETRSNNGQLECARKTDQGEPKEHKGDEFGVINPRSHQQTSPPVGCCNGVPYNASKRCCCRRASFDKETKFCCALDGCGDFKIYKRDDPNALDACRALEGIVVQEYGYHSEIEKYPNFMGQRDPPRRS
jgi:hypothetical protein